MSFAEEIKAVRYDKGLTQDQMAEALGVKVLAIRRWEAGAAVPHYAALLLRTAKGLRKAKVSRAGVPGPRPGKRAKGGKRAPTGGE